jgi:hypothetical protein
MIAEGGGGDKFALMRGRSWRTENFSSVCRTGGFDLPHYLPLGGPEKQSIPQHTWRQSAGAFTDRIVLHYERAFGTLPPGTLQVLLGDGPNVGAPWVEHAGADLVCFIGSVGVGRHIGRTAGQRVHMPQPNRAKTAISSAGTESSSCMN